jgi:hypothetical protein
MGFDFLKLLTANSNEYGRQHMNDSGCFGGFSCSSIIVQEIIQFFGMVMKISVDNRQLGGFISYYMEQIAVNFSICYSVALKDYPT